MTLHGPLQIHEAVAFILLALGYIPVFLAFMRQSETKYFFVAYTALVLGAFATNLEGYYPDGSTLAVGLNYIEHGIGFLGAGAFFFLAAYLSHQQSQYIGATISSEIPSDGGDST